MQSEKISLDKGKRKELFDYAFDVIQDEIYKEMLKNLDKLVDSDRYSNWYLGYTKIIYPYWNTHYNQLVYKIASFAQFGSIFTNYFNDKFDVGRVDSNIKYEIRVYTYDHRDRTLMIDIV